MELIVGKTYRWKRHVLNRADDRGFAVDIRFIFQGMALANTTDGHGKYLEGENPCFKIINVSFLFIGHGDGQTMFLSLKDCEKDLELEDVIGDL